jgi:hypothetical protein
MTESLKSGNSRRNTVPNNPFTQLESLVQDAEVHRHARNTAEVQRYLDTHPELPNYTRHVTNEIKEKIIFHLANGDKVQEAQIRGEVEALQAHITTAHEPGDILFALLAEEIVLSFLMLRQSDMSHARNYGQTSTQALRRADTAHVRLMRSIRTVASIQRLAPFINVNIGGSQQIAMAN